MKRKLILGILLCLFGYGSHAQNYDKEFVKQVKKLIGKDANHYKFLSYPVDNFGVLTFYHDSPTDGNQLCASFRCMGLPFPKNDSDWLSMYNYTDNGQGGHITLSTKSQTEIAIKTMLPKIFEILNISGSFDSKKVVTATVDINAGYKRVFVPDLVYKKLDSLPVTNYKDLKWYYTNKRLVYVAADYVIDKMTVTISIDQSVALQIDAALKIKPGADTANVNNPNLNMSFKKTAAGSYTIAFNKPVVVARLLKPQPAEGGLSAEDDSYISGEVEDPSRIKK